MIPSLHRQIAALPLTSPTLDVGNYVRGGRLYSNLDSYDPLWLAELVRFPSDPQVVPMRRIVMPRPLVQNFFISADQSHFHQLLITEDGEGAGENPRMFRALLTQTPGLPAMALHWESSHPVLDYCRSDRMTLSLHLRRKAAGDTLLDGAFYAFSAGRPSPVPTPLAHWWRQISARSQ